MINARRAATGEDPCDPDGVETTFVTLSTVDAEEVLALQTEVHTRQLKGQTRMPLLTQTTNDIAADLADKRMLCLGVRDERGHLLAAVRAYVGSATAQVGRLCVLPTLQNIGLAQDLVGELEQRMPEHVREVHIFTEEDATHAREFYARLGYEESRVEAMEAGFHIIELSKKLAA